MPEHIEIKEALGLTDLKKKPRPLLLFVPFIFFALGALLIAVSSASSGRNMPISPVSLAGADDKAAAISVHPRPKILRTTDNYPPSSYFPSSTTPKFTDTLGDITAFSFAAMDRDTRELVVARNLTSPRQMASIAKVMTALVAIENTDLASEFLVSDTATRAGEAAMGLTAGERVNLQELLYGLLLPSGNDAAETIAEGIFLGKDQLVSASGGSVLGEASDASFNPRFHARATFIARMNEKAKTIGMADTIFVNPTGLDAESTEKSSSSTVLDLLALGNYALDNEEIRKIVSTKFITFPYKANYHKAFALTNILGLRQSYPGVAGIKPGNTDLAGETLLSYTENGGRKIILVLLGSERTRDDAVKIYDYLFAKMGVVVKKSPVN